MKTFHFAALLSLAACGGATMNADSGTGGGTASTGGGAGGGTGGGTAQTGCATYCTDVAANCKTANAQYSSEGSCLGACAAWMAGTAGATSGNTLACHAYHAAAATSDPALHCPHAGPAGDGVCGSNCDAFCTIALHACPSVFADLAACTTACGAYATNTARYNANTTSGNSFACRMYHLSVAATDAASAAVHCGHIGPSSPPCQ